MPLRSVALATAYSAGAALALRAAPADEAMVKKRSLASLREWVDQSRHRLDEWQKQVDGKIRSTIDNISQTISPWASINKDVKTLADRIEELEAKLRELEAHEEPRPE